jgi:hypothetical protein
VIKEQFTDIAIATLLGGVFGFERKKSTLGKIPITRYGENKPRMQKRNLTAIATDGII